MLHALRVLGERLTADHQIVGVEHVAQQRDSFAEHPRPLGEQRRGPARCPAGPPQHRRRSSTSGRSAGMMPRLRAAASTASSLTVDSSPRCRPAGRTARAGWRSCRARWPASAPGRRSTARSRRSRGRRRTGWSPSVGWRRTPSSSSAPAIASTCDGHRHRQAQRLGEHRPDGGVRPAQPRVVDVPGGAVDHAAGGDADPQRAAPVPAAQVAARAAGQRGQRRPLGAARRRRLDRVERAAEQVGGHDAGGAGADVDAQRQERFVVDLDGDARAADRSRHRQVGALAQHARRRAGR